MSRGSSPRASRRPRAPRRAVVLVVVALALLSSPASGAAHSPRPPRARVLTVQRLFHVLGYPLGRERRGAFGARTRGALSYFQRKYRLPVTGYPDARTVAEMRAVAASLRAAPLRAAPAGDRPRERDLIDRLLGSVPILALGLACALGLALLALAARRGEPLPDR